MPGPAPDQPDVPDESPLVAELDLEGGVAIASVALGASGTTPDGVWDHEVGVDDHRWMAEALAMAEHGLGAGELPIGAVVVAGGQVVGRAFTQERTQGRLLVHAELLALDQADRTHGVTRVGTVLYTTLEPCLMCLGAAATAMVDRVVFGLSSPGDGAVEVARAWESHRQTMHVPHVRLPPVVGGVLAEESADLFRRFRAGRPGPSDPLAQWAGTLLDAASVDVASMPADLPAEPPSASGPAGGDRRASSRHDHELGLHEVIDVVARPPDDRGDPEPDVGIDLEPES